MAGLRVPHPRAGPAPPPRTGRCAPVTPAVGARGGSSGPWRMPSGVAHAQEQIRGRFSCIASSLHRFFVCSLYGQTLPIAHSLLPPCILRSGGIRRSRTNCRPRPFPRVRGTTGTAEGSRGTVRVPPQRARLARIGTHRAAGRRPPMFHMCKCHSKEDDRLVAPNESSDSQPTSAAADSFQRAAALFRTQPEPQFKAGVRVPDPRCRPSNQNTALVSSSPVIHGVAPIIHKPSASGRFINLFAATRTPSVTG